MIDIDFLPQTYQDQQARRESGVWCLTVALVLGGAVAVASLSQFAETRRTAALASAVQPQYVAAQSLTLQLATLQTTLNDAKTQALLYTIVEAPWRRSQILLAVVSKAPASVRLEELIIRSTLAPQAAGEEVAVRRAQSGNRPEQPAAPSARSDLASLSEMLRQRLVVCSLSGQTDNVAALEAYLRSVEASEFVARVEMASLENDPQDASGKRMRFEARISIRTPLESDPPSKPTTPANLASN